MSQCGWAVAGPVGPSRGCVSSCPQLVRVALTFRSKAPATLVAPHQARRFLFNFFSGSLGETTTSFSPPSPSLTHLPPNTFLLVSPQEKSANMSFGKLYTYEVSSSASSSWTQIQRKRSCTDAAACHRTTPAPRPSALLRRPTSSTSTLLRLTPPSLPPSTSSSTSSARFLPSRERMATSCTRPWLLPSTVGQHLCVPRSPPTTPLQRDDQPFKFIQLSLSESYPC